METVLYIIKLCLICGAITGILTWLGCAFVEWWECTK